MTNLFGLRVAVGGAGVLGAASALALARAGASVILADPAPLGMNASGVAAGMLAPAFEAALDPTAGDEFALLREARDAWPQFVAGLRNVALFQDGARFEGNPDDVATVGARLGDLGADYTFDGGGLFTSEDWRLDPLQALTALQEALHDLGGRRIHVPVESVMDQADLSVLACGFEAAELAPELALLRPIKGQLIRFTPGEVDRGPVRRTRDGYLVPSALGAIVGATMEEGVRDLAIDASVSERLAALAGRLTPELAGRPYRASVGVRAATPDGLPLVGPSVRERVLIAAGARRNGWLLAPMIAAMVVAAAGGETSAQAQRFSPARFSRPERR